MKKLLQLILLFLLCETTAQVGIGNTNPKSILDISASNVGAPIATDGLLIPRVTAFPTPVTAAQNGMLVFVTTAFSGNQVGMYYYDHPSLTWKWIASGGNANVWTNNNANTRIEVPKLSDGTTNRPTGNTAVFTDSGNFGIGIAAPTKSFVLSQKNATDGFQFTGTAASGPSTGTGFLTTLGYNVVQNKQLWFGDVDYIGLSTGAFARFATINGIPSLDAVRGDNIDRARLQIGVAGDTKSGVILANTSVNGGFGVGGTSGNAALTGAIPTGSLSVDGNIGVGTISPTTKLDVVGATNTSTGYYFGGTSSPANVELVRALSTTVNNTIEIGNFNITHGTHNFRLSVTSDLSNFSVAKSYIVSAKYDQTANAWQKLSSISDSGSYGGNDFEIDIRITNGQTFLRLRRSAGIIAGGDVKIRIESTGAIIDTFTATSALAIGVATPTATFSTNLNSWNVTGNIGTVDGSNFIGNTDNIPLNFRVNNTKAGKLSQVDTFYGYQAGNANTSTEATAIGYRSLFVNTTGKNTAVGYETLQGVTSSNFNAAFGNAALRANTGANNTAVGANALTSNTTASELTAIGFNALTLNSTGIQNTAIGSKALAANLTTSENTAIGFEALRLNIGASNVAIGSKALTNNTNGNNNVAIGTNASAASTTTNTTAVGTNALSKNTGAGNTAIGFSAMLNNSIGTSNTAVGIGALQANTTENHNTAIGSNALSANTGNTNTAIGSLALQSNTTGGSNSALGFGALGANTIATDNTAMGRSSLAANTGNNNSAFGSISLAANTAGTNNTGIGNQVLRGNTTGNNNSGIGFQALYNNIIGDNNTAIGWSALQGVTGSNNTGLGHNSGSAITTGNNNIAIGSGAQVPTNTVNNQLSIGNAIYGVTMSTTALSKIGIGTPTPTEKLDVLGNIKFSGALMPNDLSGNGGQVLASTGTGTAPVWESKSVLPFASTGALTGTYNVTVAEYTIRIRNSITIVNLPTAVGNLGKIYILIGSSGITAKTLSTAGGNVIDDATGANVTSIAAGQRFMIQSDNVDWIVIGN